MGIKSSPVVLIAEDNTSHMELLSYNIKSAGFNVVKAFDGRTALELIREKKPDILLLDWMLPKMSGLEICNYIRNTKKMGNIPIIMVTAREDVDDRIRGLDTGADDYIVKPFIVSEVVARIKANLRRIRPSSVGETITFEDITLDSEQHKVYRDGKLIKLGPTEYSLLATFIEKPGKVWSREQLLDRIWGQSIHVEIRTIDVHIGRLRKALCQYDGIDLLRTVRGSGYSLG